MAGEKLKKLKKPIQGMAPEVEAKFNAANEEEFPKRCAWKIEMETMRRQLAVLTKQFQKYKPPQDPEFKHQWEGNDQNQRYESKYEQKWKGSVKIDVPEFSGVLIPDDLIDWINHVECVFEYHDIPNHKKVKLVGTKLKGRASAWWEQIQMQRVRFEALTVPTSLSNNLGKSKNAQPVQSAHTSNNVATKTSFVGKPKNSNLSCKHYKYGEESHKSIECKKPALQAKNKTLMTKTMEEESDAATGSNIPIMQLDATIQCSNWQQHSSTAAFQYSEGMMKGILMIENNQEEDYLQEPVYDQYQEAEEVSEGILMIEEIVEQPPVYDIEVEAKIGDDQAKSITLEGMMTFKPMSNQFVLENMDATTKILQVSKEEMEEKNRLASKISHTTCSSEDKACDLLIEGSHCHCLNEETNPARGFGSPNTLARKINVEDHAIIIGASVESAGFLQLPPQTILNLHSWNIGLEQAQKRNYQIHFPSIKITGERDIPILPALNPKSGYVGVAGSCLGGLRDSQAITTSSSVKVQLLEPRRPQTHRETRTFRHAVIQGKVDAVLAGFEFDGYGKIEGNSNSLGANHVEIDLKLILSVNPNGRWVVEWVGPSNAAPGPQQPNLNKTWRAKPSSKPSIDPVSYPKDPESSLVREKNRTHQEEAVGEFSISESSSEVFSEGKASRADDFQVTDVPVGAKDWFLQLRNGKSVRLPHEVVCSHKFRLESLLPPFSVGNELGLGIGGSEMVVYEEDDSVSQKNTSMGVDGLVAESQGFDFVENPGHPEVELIGWDYEEAPLSVEPLAMNLKAFGEVLGASYVEFEDRVKKLLLDIEARRNKRHIVNQGTKKGSVGAARGILVMWDKRVVEKVEEVVGRFSISVTFQNVEDQFVWAFSGVYGPNFTNERQYMLDKLAGGVVLLGLAIVRTHLAPRLTTFYSQLIGMIIFPLSHKRLPRILSDHFPILLECGAIQRSARPFRFENMWLKAEGFVKKVKGWWNSYQVHGTPSFIFASKLRRSKGILKNGMWRLLGMWRVGKICYGMSCKSWMCWQRPQLDGLNFSRIIEENSTWLDRPFEEEKVMGVVMSCAGDKSPGPDGFPMAFFQACWHIIHTDLMAIFHSFHEFGEFERSLNATFLVLIPKKHDAEEVKDFQPIRLVGSVYQIIAKVLANRLRVVLPNIISETSNAFIGRRQILDLALIASECLDSRMKSGIPGVLCKLDVEKTYDHVNWNFLHYLLGRCGFSLSWQKWISSCISTAHFSILINGSPEGFFEGSCGLCQGDPLSPLLFDIVMEGLSGLLDRAVLRGLVSGFSMGNSNKQLVISHLLFTDDTLNFCDADPHQLYSLHFVFTWFEAISGLKINLGASFKEKTIWNPIIEKVEKRLARWKRLYLSKGGCVTLIKSTLSSIPTYLLSLFPMPTSVVLRIEKLQRDFLWGGLGDEKCFHLIRWDKRFGTERDHLWRKVIEAKYGCARCGWCTNQVNRPYGVSLWKTISKGWDSLNRFISFEIGDESKVSFWHDVWCGDRPLKEMYPDLFAISCSLDSLVDDQLRRHNDTLHWDLTFIWHIQDWESDSLLALLELLYANHRSGIREDTICWGLAKSKCFTVGSYYRALSGTPHVSFPWKIIWKSQAPPRVAFFVWMAALGRIMTIDNLRKRRVDSGLVLHV
uniref:Reverse transcriptase domain-containing protein n=1 Tax=Fagus sylvatica TaxID=28930 RepID=A0A2N9EHM0_FAGSY